MCALQRVRGAESRVETQTVKWTVEGVVKGAASSMRRAALSIPRRDAYVSCEGYDGILQRVRAMPVKSRWHRG